MAPSLVARIDAPPRKLAARARRLQGSATAAVMNAAAALRAAGRDLVDFGVGEPDFATPEHIREAAIRALRDNFTKYTPTGGMAELRTAIAAAHRRDYGSDYKINQTLVTVGGKHALFNAISVVVDHGDEVILPAPYWVSFRDQIVYCGGVPVIVPTASGDDFALGTEAVARAITPRTKAILLNSPANPSGAVYPPALFRKVLELCQRHRLWLISDECYVKLSYDSAPYSVASEAGSQERVIISGTFSKTYAMTGWRIGYALGPAAVIEQMLNLQSQTTGNATSFAQAGALAALEGPQKPVERMVAEYRRRRGVIVAGLRALPGLRCSMPAGAFYAYPDVAGWLSAKAATSLELSQRLLHEAGVVTVPGEAFGSVAHLRFAYAASEPVIQEGLRRLASFSASQAL